MEEDRGALLTIYDKQPNLRAKEADLQKLRQPSIVVTVEDAGSEVEEVDEQEKASIQDSHDPCAVALTNPEAIYEARRPPAAQRRRPRRGVRSQARRHGTYLYLHALGVGNPVVVPCLAR
jgi:hypothetical protein